MWQKNNGKSETEILQNLYAAYLTTAVRRCRNGYIKQSVRIQQTERETEDIQYNQEHETEEDMFCGLRLPMQLEDSALIHVLKEVNGRERYVFFARVLDERSFESPAEEMVMGNKGVTSIYYCALRKNKRKMEELRK